MAFLIKGEIDMIKPGFNVLIDGQWGSTGKGKVAAHIALSNHIDVAVSDFQANAGHTTVLDNGKKFVVHTVPSAAVNEDCMCCINPAATIRLDRLKEEIDILNLNEKRLKINPTACIVEDKHKEEEAQLLKRISSTCQGVGAALSGKIMRLPGVKLAKDIPELEMFIADTTFIVNTALKCGGTVLAETAQGFDLSINHGKIYPYVTSRDINVGSALSNSGVSPLWLSEVIGVIRTFPIRVGNVVESGKMVGYSGDCYKDQKELTWDEITEISGSPDKLEERTTVTDKVRRIFTFSKTQINKFLTVCRPTQLAITFMDYIDWNLHDKSGESLSEDAALLNSSIKARSFLTELNNEIRLIRDDDKDAELMLDYDCKITYLGTGKRNSAVLLSNTGF